jgi:hypothetical protein
MVSWAGIASEVPIFAANVRARFEAGTNKTLATLRSDGAPRISGTELEFGDDEITLGMMAASVKLRDVRRDPRIALHSPTLEPPKDDPSGWLGEAKLAGVLVGIDPPAGSPHQDAGFFRVDISEVVLTYVGAPADHLVIESWHAGRGWQRRTRT